MEGKFKIKPDGFNDIRNKVLLLIIPMMLIALIGGLAISQAQSNNGTSNLNTLLLIIPIASGTLFFGIFNGLRRQKNIFNSFILTIDQDTITREQNLMPIISIPLSEIRKIVKSPNGSISIIGKTPQEFIVVPAQIENGIELESRLSAIREITIANKKPKIHRYLLLLPVIVISLMAIVYLSTNKLLVGLSGSVLTIGLIYFLFIIKRSRHVDKKTKKGLWLGIFVVLVIMAITYRKLTN